MPRQPSCVRPLLYVERRVPCAHRGPWRAQGGPAGLVAWAIISLYVYKCSGVLEVSHDGQRVEASYSTSVRASGDGSLRVPPWHQSPSLASHSRPCRPRHGLTNKILMKEGLLWLTFTSETSTDTANTYVHVRTAKHLYANEHKYKTHFHPAL